MGSTVGPQLLLTALSPQARSPYGPWTRRDAPILEPTGVNGTWDQLFVTNPAR
jgi:hypothetical protein